MAGSLPATPLLSGISASNHSADHEFEPRRGKEAAVARAAEDFVEEIMAAAATEAAAKDAAVDAWVANATLAAAVYGPISGWSTTLVTDLGYLFCGSTDIGQGSDSVLAATGAAAVQT